MRRMCDVQDPYGRTPLHVAATNGALRTCDGMVSTNTHGINCVDVFGTTALDNARSRGHSAVEALILAKGGLPSSDPRIAAEHDKVPFPSACARVVLVRSLVPQLDCLFWR
jgi:ankyrin repeat protein